MVFLTNIDRIGPIVCLVLGRHLRSSLIPFTPSVENFTQEPAIENWTQLLGGFHSELFQEVDFRSRVH